MLRRLVPPALLLLVVLGAPAAGAETICSTTSTIDPTGGDPSIQDTEETPGSCTSGVNDGTNFVSSSGEASFGTLRARSEATFADPALFETAESGVSAQFRDMITVNAPGLTGERGFVRASVFVSGFIDLTGNTRAQVSLLNLGSSAFFADCDGSLNCLGVPGYPRVFSESVDTSFPVTFGEPTLYFLRLSTFVLPGGSLIQTPGTADVDFSGTAAWEGISEVTYEGNPVAFTIEGDSGFDYVNPVPEPGRAILMLVGAIGLAALGRRS